MLVPSQADRSGGTDSLASRRHALWHDARKARLNPPHPGCGGGGGGAMGGRLVVSFQRDAGSRHTLHIRSKSRGRGEVAAYSFSTAQATAVTDWKCGCDDRQCRAMSTHRPLSGCHRLSRPRTRPPVGKGGAIDQWHLEDGIMICRKLVSAPVESARSTDIATCATAVRMHPPGRTAWCCTEASSRAPVAVAP